MRIHRTAALRNIFGPDHTSSFTEGPRPLAVGWGHSGPPLPRGWGATRRGGGVLLTAPCAELVEQIRYVLQTSWGLPVVCECISDKQDSCTGCCCGPICKAMGMVMVRGQNGSGLAFVEPAAVTGSWDLRLGPPLLSPRRAYHGYLGAIFTDVLKNGLPFTDSWAAQILSAAAWLQVAILSGYGRAVAMRAMHKGVYRVVYNPHA